MDDLYKWEDRVAKSGTHYLILNDNPKYVIFTSNLMWVANKKYGYADDLESAKAMVEGLFDNYSLPKDKRWLSI